MSGEGADAYSDVGQGQPVVLLHGGVANRALWQPTFELLSRSYRAIAIDYGGHGDSARPRAEATLEDYVEEVREMLRRLALPVPPVLLGHSVGGMIGLLYALRYPDEVKALLLVGVTARMDRWMRAFLQREIDLVRAYGPEIWRRAGRLLTERNRVALHTHPAALVAVQRIVADWDFHHYLARIRVPVHLASGRLDLISRPRHLRAMARMLPNATVTVLPGGHSCMDSRPVAFQKWLMEKLADLDDAAIAPRK